MNFVDLLHYNKYVFGVETFYGEPVWARVFFDAGSMNISDLKSFIEYKKNDLQISNDRLANGVNFVCVGKGK